MPQLRRSISPPFRHATASQAPDQLSTYIYLSRKQTYHLHEKLEYLHLECIPIIPNLHAQLSSLEFEVKKPTVKKFITGNSPVSAPMRAYSRK
jgi:hypothetical protein